MNFQNVIDINSVINCARNLKGVKSNSASPSDILVFDFSPNSNYNGESIRGGFQKIFISNFESLYRNNRYLLTKEAVESTDALYYEYYVYIEKIRNLLEKNVNPHFVKVLGGVRDTSYDNFEKYVESKIGVPISRIQLRNNFVENLNHIGNLIPGRESLTKNYNGAYYDRNLDRILSQARYGFILTEGVDFDNTVNSLSTFENLQVGRSTTLKTFLSILKDTLDSGSTSEKSKVVNLMYMFYFQIISACYAIYLAGLNHNDLHPGNVIIKKISPRINEYNIEGNKWTIYTEYTCMLYDFDRANCENYRNELNDIIYRRNIGNLTNTLASTKDIAKALFYTYTTLVDSYGTKLRDASGNVLVDSVLSVISKPSVNKDLIGNFFNTHRATYIESKITTRQLDYLDRPVNMLTKIYNLFQSFNQRRLAANPNVTLYIYSCNSRDFTNFNLNMQSSLLSLKTSYNRECDDEKNALQTQTNNLQTNLNVLQTNLNTLQTENNNLQAESNRLRSENTGLQAESNNLRTQNSTLQNDVNNLRNRQADLIAEGNRLLGEFNKLQQDCKIAETNYNVLKEQSNKSQRELAQTQNKYNKIQSRYDTLQQDFNNASSKISSLEISLENYKKAYNSIVAASGKSSKDLEKITELNTKMELMKKELEDKYQSLSKSYNDLQLKYSSCTQNEVQLKTEVNKLREEYRSLKASNDKTVRESKEAERDCNISKTRNKELLAMNRRIVEEEKQKEKNYTETIKRLEERIKRLEEEDITQFTKSFRKMSIRE